MPHLTSTHRLALVTVLAVALALVGAGLLAGPGTLRAQSPAPTAQELSDLHDDIDWDELERGGIFVTTSGVDERRRCVEIELLNPSPAHLAFIRARYGAQICPDPEPAGAYAVSGVGCGVGGPRTRVVRVPDVRALPPHLAARRMRAAGLSDCHDGPPEPPGRFDAQNALRVVGQCPRAGRRVRLPALWATSSRGVLPGGFTFVAGGGAGEACR